MSYRLKSGKSPAKQFSRIVKDQLEDAARTVSKSPIEGDAVRDVRKRIKKVRALVRLLQESLGRDYGRFNTLLRSIGRQLSATRDAEAADETLAAVCRHYPALIPVAAKVRVAKGLADRGRKDSVPHPERLRHDLARAARTVPSHVHRLTGKIGIRRGILEGYEAAWKAMRRLATANGDADFHRWRRRVKDHWYQLRLLEEIQPALRTRIRRLKRLETLLGDDHNLVVLRGYLIESPARFGDEGHVTLVLGCIDLYGATLRKQAMKLGTRLLGTKRPPFQVAVRG